MGITVDWDNNPHTVIRYDFTGFWQWDEFHKLHQQAATMIAQVDHEVAVLFNLKGAPELPIGALNALRRMVALSPANMSVIVAVDSSSTTERTINTLSHFDRTLGNKLIFADSIARARGMLSAHHKYGARRLSQTHADNAVMSGVIL